MSLHVSRQLVTEALRFAHPSFDRERRIVTAEIPVRVGDASAVTVASVYIPNIGWRLDYVLASAPLAARARRCVSLREVGTSDHGPVVAELELDGKQAVESSRGGETKPAEAKAVLGPAGLARTPAATSAGVVEPTSSSARGRTREGAGPASLQPVGVLQQPAKAGSALARATARRP